MVLNGEGCGERIKQNQVRSREGTLTGEVGKQAAGRAAGRGKLGCTCHGMSLLFLWVAHPSPVRKAAWWNMGSIEVTWHTCLWQ